MKIIKEYQKFYDNRKFDLLLEEVGFLFESEEASSVAPKQAQSEKEIIEEMPEEEKKKIEDLIAKHFPEVKGKVDLDKSTDKKAEKGEEGEEGSKEGDKEGEKTNEEGGILLAITVASLIPACLEAVGSMANFLKREFGINMDDKKIEQMKKLNEAIAAYKSMSKSIKEGKKPKVRFLGNAYFDNNWFEISNALSKHLGNKELEFGHQPHEHKPLGDALGIDKSDRVVPEEEKQKKAEKEAAKLNPKGEPKFSKLSLDTEISRLKVYRDKLFGSDFGNWLKEKGHQLHSLYTSPIRATLKGIAFFSKPSSVLRDSKVREKVANIIYAGFMITLAGYGIMSSISHLAGLSEVAQIFLKGLESGVQISEIRKEAIMSILKT